MQTRWLIVLFLLLSACTKESINNPHSYLELYVEGEEESKKWETITGEWDDSTGKMVIEANGYYLGTCRIAVENVKGVGAISPTTLSNFYYTDGVDLRPNNVKGSLMFTEVNRNVVRGKFNIYLENDYNQTSGLRVVGVFCILKK